MLSGISICRSTESDTLLKLLLHIEETSRTKGPLFSDGRLVCTRTKYVSFSIRSVLFQIGIYIGSFLHTKCITQTSTQLKPGINLKKKTLGDLTRKNCKSSTEFVQYPRLADSFEFLEVLVPFGCSCSWYC